MKNFKKIVLTVIHIFLFASTFILTVKGVTRGADSGQLGENMMGTGYFKAFTSDSNIFVGITSLIAAVILIKNLLTKKDDYPYAVILLQYISSISIGLTFITTALFLAPTQVSLGNSYWLYFSGDLFFLHFLNPCLAIGAYICSDDNYTFKIKELVLGLLPVLVYAVVYIICAVVLNIWSDFYGFTFGGHNEIVPLVFIIVTAVTFGIGVCINFLKKLL